MKEEVAEPLKNNTSPTRPQKSLLTQTSNHKEDQYFVIAGPEEAVSQNNNQTATGGLGAQQQSSGKKFDHSPDSMKSIEDKKNDIVGWTKAPTLFQVDGGKFQDSTYKKNTIS